jgi:predicted nucleic acid-binding protein
VVVALLTGEQRDQDEIDGMLEVVDLVDRRQAMLITSAILRTEVLEDINDPTVIERLEAMFRRPSCVMIDTNRAILEKARALRTAVKASKRSLKTPDAIFVATGLLHGADALHTFDDKLLALNGRAEVDGLRIVKPHGVQTLLL